MRAIVIAGCCAVMLSIGAAGAGSGVQLLEAIAGHGDEIDARTGQVWMGLSPANGGFQWRSGRVEVRRYYDVIVDAPGERSGKEIRFSGAPPVFLVRGLTIPPSVRVQTAFHSSTRRALADGPVDLKIANRTYRLRLTGVRRSDSDPPVPAALVLETGGTTQTLYRWPNGFLDEACYLIWAGDLDGDGKLDLYLHLSDHYNVLEHTLFASGGSRAGYLVERIAAWITTGC